MSILVPEAIRELRSCQINCLHLGCDGMAIETVIQELPLAYYNIQYMMAQIWIDKDGLGLDAYDDSYFKKLAEKYNFNCKNYEEAKAIMQYVINRNSTD